MNRNRRTQERIDSALQTFTRMIESGTFPEQIGRITLLTVSGDIPSAKWSAGNQLLMLAAGTADARGYRQWQAAGRQVRRGAKAFYIFTPLTVTKTKTDPDTGEDVTQQFIIGFGTTPVFRIEDTEGEDGTIGYEPPTLPPLIEVAEEWGITVRYGPSPGTYAGYYRPGTHAEIVLCTHAEKTFFHELAHAAHDRLGGLTEGGQDARQEIVAETAAAALSTMYGYSGYEQYSRDYIARYAGTKDDAQGTVREIMRYVGEVRDVLTHILTTADKLNTTGAAA